MLRAHAARKMRHERKLQCRHAARETAIGAVRSMDRASKSQVADKLSFRCVCAMSAFDFDGRQMVVAIRSQMLNLLLRLCFGITDRVVIYNTPGQASAAIKTPILV
jgi:hypothetical protein